MDETGMFRRGVDPSRTLELINITKPLNPRRIDQILFCAFVRIGIRIGNGERHILVDRIGDEGGAVIGGVDGFVNLLHKRAAS